MFKSLSSIWIRKSLLAGSKHNLEELKSDSEWRTKEIPRVLKLGKLLFTHIATESLK
jgi:hypothetical protein